MAVATPKLRINTLAQRILPGRGFYQLEEDSLYVQIAPFSRTHRFFSYLEAPNIRLELDKEGRLLFMEVCRARRHWAIADTFQPPRTALPADVRWLDFRETIKEPLIITDHRQRRLLLEFVPQVPDGSYYLAKNVIVQTSGGDNLAAFWVTSIVDDFAGREIAAFRKAVRSALSAKPTLASVEA